MRLRVLALPVIAAMLLASCGNDENGGGGGNTGSVSVFSAMEPQEGTALQEVLDELVNSNTDYTAEVETSKDFESQAKSRIEGGNAPDVIMYPQPGAVIEQARAGKAIALEDLGFTVAELERMFGKYLVSLGEYNGKHYALPTNVNLKSMVWYPKKAFDAKGYTVPKNWTELIALSERIKADGAAPWCAGFESGTSSGWPATDWMEDIVLRTGGADTYDKWVKHQIPFNDASIRRAGELFGDVMFPDGFVLGGAANSASVKFGDAPTPMFDDPPKCFLHRQATFINSFFPENVQAGVDYDWFPFPDIDTKGTLFGGELSAVFRDAPEVRDFLRRFAGREVQCAQGAKQALSRVSPNLEVGSDCYANSILSAASRILLASIADSSGRFDASDMMPPSVGSGSFWTGMIKYLKEGPGSLDGVLNDIEASWPR